MGGWPLPDGDSSSADYTTSALDLPSSDAGSRRGAKPLVGRELVYNPGMSAAGNEPKFEVRSLDFYYGAVRALSQIEIDIQPHQITALIGPSGCGKSTFLRCLNRMNDTIPGTHLEGEVLLDGVDIYQSELDPVDLRQRVGMVFQKPNPFPQSVFDNVAYGPRILGSTASRSDLEAIVERALRTGCVMGCRQGPLE